MIHRSQTDYRFQHPMLPVYLWCNVSQVRETYVIERNGRVHEYEVPYDFQAFIDGPALLVQHEKGIFHHRFDIEFINCSRHSFPSIRTNKSTEINLHDVSVF